MLETDGFRFHFLKQLRCETLGDHLLNHRLVCQRFIGHEDPTQRTRRASHTRDPEALEELIGQPSESFLLSALLIQLWHLQRFVGEPFKAKHLATRDELLNRLGVDS
jgi:hypothetical protein